MITPKMAATRSALGVSLAVSWYSGAKVAQHSIPYDDQHIVYSQTIIRVKLATPSEPAVALMLSWRFALSHLPSI